MIRISLRRDAVLASLLLTLFGASALAQQSAGKAPLTYIRDIKPIFKDRCVVCHNRDTVKNTALSGGLALDAFAAIKAGVKGRAAFVAGKSGQSELIKRIEATSPTLLMPKGGPALSQAQIELVRRWIDAGALAGDLAKEAGASIRAVEPLPANPALTDIALPTRIAPTADLREKTTPQNATLEFALKIGPLPTVTALAYSPDGKTLAAGTYRAVTLWDTQAGKPILTIAPLTGAVQSLAFRPDGQILAIAGGAPGVSGEARLYDMNAKRLLNVSLAGHSDIVYSVAWSKDGKRIATASHDKTARIWEADSGKELQILKEHSEAVTRVVFAPDGKSVYTASLDRNVRRFTVSDGKMIRTFSGHSDAIYALAISPDGKGLVSSGVESRLRWWNPDDGNTTRYGDGSQGQVNEIVFSGDGKRLASVDSSGRVRLWDAAGGGQQRALEGAQDWLYAVALSPDGKFAAGAGSDGLIYLWQTENGALRLRCAAWYPSPKGTDWFALTPEGFAIGSPDWLSRIRARLAGKELPTAFQSRIRPALAQPEAIPKALQGAPLEPFKLPEAKKP